MKKILYSLMALMCFSFVACDDDAWSDGDPAMEHIYYIGFEKWGYDDTKKGNNNVVHYEVAQGETVAVPMQFWCEFVRSYDVITYYYVTGDLVRGIDYEIVDANGQVLQPNADGAFTLTWPNAKKGVQNVYVKALNGAIGSFRLQTFNPNSSVTLSNQDVSSTIQSQTADYEVRVFTQNYYVTINIQ
ncbi:MAG: hypothetical protein IJ456_10810 [Bacteroides sp.]|nr:hypothetical protein [Bacteroides sp.]